MLLLTLNICKHQVLDLEVNSCDITKVSVSCLIRDLMLNVGSLLLAAAFLQSFGLRLVKALLKLNTSSKKWIEEDQELQSKIEVTS